MIALLIHVVLVRVCKY